MTNPAMAALSARTLRYLEGTDVAAITAEEGIEELNAALAASAAPDQDLDLLQVAGWFLWCRHLALGEDAGREALDGAIRLFAPLWTERPDFVPLALHPYFEQWAVDAQSLSADPAALLQSALDSGDAGALDEAIEANRQAVAAAGDDSARITGLANLGLAHRVRFVWRRDVDDLDAAVQAADAAVAALPDESPDRPSLIASLAEALRMRYELRGDPADRERLISTAEAEADARAPDDPERVRPLMTLGLLLQSRFEDDGDPDDLDRAVALGTAVLAELDDEHPLRTGVLSTLATSLRRRDAVHPSASDLDRAIQLHQAAVEAAPPDDPHRGIHLYNLAQSLLTRFERSADRADLDRAVDAADEATVLSSVAQPGDTDAFQVLYRAVLLRSELFGADEDAERSIALTEQQLALAPAEAAEHAVLLSMLGDLLMTRYDRLGRPGDLDGVVDAQERALAAGLSGVLRLDALAGLSTALRLRYARDRDATDLERWVAVGSELVTEMPADASQRPTALATLAQALHTRSQRTDDASDLDRSVDLMDEVVASAPADHPQLATFLRNHFGVSLDLFRRSDDAQDLGRAITTGERFVASVPDSAGSTDLAELSRLVLVRFERTGSREDLDRAIELGERALDLAHPGDPEHADALAHVPVLLRRRFELVGDRTDIDRAVALAERAVPAAAEDDRADRVAELAYSLQLRSVQVGDPDDLDRAVEQWRLAVASTADGDPDRPMYQAQLAQALRIRYLRARAREDGTAAVQAASDSVSRAGAGHPHRAGLLSGLALALQSRFEREGDLADLDAAIAHYREAVTTASEQDREGARWVSNLGLALRIRFERLGDPRDLDQAVELSERAAREFPHGSAYLPAALTNLGTALRIRFELEGATADLDRAVAAGQRAVDEASPGHPERLLYLSNLCLALRVRYSRLGDPSDLDRAVDAGQHAVDLVPPGDASVGPPALSNLAGALLARYRSGTHEADLDRAIDVAERAVRESMPHDPSRFDFLINLAAALSLKSSDRGSAADLDRAVEVAEQAVAAAPDDHPSWGPAMYNLGLLLADRAAAQGGSSDRGAAVRVLREAAASTTTRTATRLTAAQAAGRLASGAGDWGTAVEDYELAVRLLALVAAPGFDREGQEYWLSEFVGLGSEAVAACLEAGQVDRAVQLWEQGRGVLLGQALDARADLSELRARRPDLAARFVRLRHELDAGSAGTPADDAGVAITGVADPARRRAAATELEEVLAEARREPGLDRFLLPVPVQDLLTEASDGAVVLINVAGRRADALVLLEDRVEHVPLPGLPVEAVADHVLRLEAALDLTRDPMAGPEGWAEGEETIADVLAWSWDNITGPVLDRIGLTGRPEGPENAWPRVWWCPSGLLSFLPLHAAGRHETRFDPSPRTVLDRVISSYTPTVRALSHARTGSRPVHAPGAPDHERILVVAMPRTPGAADLAGTVEEAVLLADLFPGRIGLLHGELREDEIEQLSAAGFAPQGVSALHDTVTSALREVRWAHFACHAWADIRRPSSSHLLLHDHLDRPLTVLELAQLRLADAELAFLSACATARTGVLLADEVIQLAAGCQLAGYRHVIATMWPIGDRAAVRIAADVYETLQKEGAAATSVALHRAVRRRRNVHVAQPSTWAAHTHTGA